MFAKKKKKKHFLLISGIIILSLLVGGGFLIIKNKSKQVSNSPSDKPVKEEKKPVPPKDNPNSPQPNPDPANNNKVELKIFWAGSLEIIDEYRDYWKFTVGTSTKVGKESFLIAKNNPLFANKKLDQEDLTFTLSYSEKEVVKKIEKTDNAGVPTLTILESGFNFVPNSPWQVDPNFFDKWHNTKDQAVYFDYSKYNGGDYVFIDNQILEGKAEKDCDKYVFSPDNPSIKELLAKNHLQIQNGQSDKEFSVFYLERDIKKYDPNTRAYYFHNGARIKNGYPRP